MGHTSAPLSRLRSIKNGNPFKVDLIYAVECPGDMRHIFVEKLSHKILKNSHSNGEWFLTTDDDALWAVRKAHTLVYAVDDEANLCWGAVQ